MALLPAPGFLPRLFGCSAAVSVGALKRYVEDPVRRRPSERNYAILAHREAGNSIEVTAKMFRLSASRTRKIELQTRDYAEAARLLKDDPDNLLLLARVGKLVLSAAHALDRA